MIEVCYTVIICACEAQLFYFKLIGFLVASRRPRKHETIKRIRIQHMNDRKHIWRKRNGFCRCSVCQRSFLWQDGCTLHSLAKWTFAHFLHKWSWIRTLQSTNVDIQSATQLLQKLQLEIFKRTNIKLTEAKCIIARGSYHSFFWTCTSPRPCRPARKHRNNDNTR